MSNPYYIDEPAAISFSGGRTSAYMLIQILEAHNGQLPDYVKVLFANTGKEMPQTLDFVHRCERELSIKIHWLELAAIEDVSGPDEKTKYARAVRETDYQGASRNGEPFEVLLSGFDSIPNAVFRTCTVNLKLRVMVNYLRSIGFESPWLQYIGIRADEERRAKKLHGKIDEGHEAFCPLYVAGVTKEDVGEFWRGMPWDLELPNNNGTTDLGNCDLCFLKSRSKRASIMRERPDLAQWWIDAEEKKGQFFRPDEGGYKLMRDYSLSQYNLFDGEEDDPIPCFCGD